MSMINRVVRLLVLSDFVIAFAFGLLAPIFAVFILDNIEGSSLSVIGIATACYWISRAISTVPLSRFMDRTDGERDEFYFMIIGTFIFSSVPLFYLVIHTPIQLYLVQIVFGVALSMASPAWKILFTDHIDRGKVGYEWSLDDVGIAVSTGVSAFIGATLADKFGFPIVLILLSMLGYLGTMFLIPIHRDAKSLEQIKKEGKLEAIIKRRKNSAPFKIDGNIK